MKPIPTCQETADELMKAVLHGSVADEAEAIRADRARVIEEVTTIYEGQTVETWEHMRERLLK